VRKTLRARECGKRTRGRTDGGGRQNRGKTRKKTQPRKGVRTSGFDMGQDSKGGHHSGKSPWISKGRTQDENQEARSLVHSHNLKGGGVGPSRRSTS